MDRFDGRIADLVHAQATLTPTEADSVIREQLDGYLNFVYRAAKSRRDGRPDLAKLDEIEAAPWFLETPLRLHGRIRPYYKFLHWELDTHPLPAPLPHQSPNHAPSTPFPALEHVAREKGFGACSTSGMTSTSYADKPPAR